MKRNVSMRKKFISVFSCLLVIFAAYISVSIIQQENDISAAAPTIYISAAANFDKFSNGKTYTYSTPTGTKTVTVSTSAAWGTETNPFVIKTAGQWALLANKVMAANYTNTAHVNDVYVLDADIDFQGNTYLTPSIGGEDEAKSFSGKFYGQRHTLKNAYFANPNSTKNFGAFSHVSSATITDFSIDKSCQILLPSTLPNSIEMGFIAGTARAANFINLVSNASINYDSKLVDLAYSMSVGGIAGTTYSGCKFYKCGNTGAMTLTGGKTSENLFLGDNNIRLGGLVGENNAGDSLNIENCFSYGNLTSYYGGPCIGGLVGRTMFSNTVATSPYLIFKNCYIDFDINHYYGGSPDVSATVGYPSNTPTNPSGNGSLYFENIFFRGRCNNEALLSIYNAVNIPYGPVVNNFVGTTENGNSIGGFVTTVKNRDELITKAQSSLNGWTFNGEYPVVSGGPTSSYSITYQLNGGTQGANPPTSYTNTVAVTLPTPTKKGYNFEGWHSESVTGPKLTNIPVGDVGNKVLYANWTLKAPTVSVNNVSAVTYGKTVTLTATPSHEVSVTYTYQWYKDNTVISGKTSASITLSAISESGSYKCRVTAKDTDNKTAYKDTDARTVSITKATPALTAPTFSGTAYVGQKLSDITLSGGAAKNPNNNAAIEGTFSWTTPSTKIDSTNKTYSVTFTPKDTTNYNTATVNITVKATQLTVTFVEKFKDDPVKTIRTDNVDHGSTLSTAKFPTIPTHAGYTGKYDQTTDIANITANKTVTATYTANTNTKYVVEHYKQNADGTYPTTASDKEEKTGTTDTTATATAKSYDGFSYTSSAAGTVTSGNIAGDGTLVLKLYYARNTYKLTYESNSGSAVSDSSALYGAAVAKPADPIRYGFTFAGWYKESALTTPWVFSGAGADTMPLNGATVYAKWTLKDISSNVVTADRQTGTYGQGKVTLTTAAAHEGTASGNVTLSYQWYRGGVKIAGETGVKLVLNGNVADSGVYKCEVTASGGGQTKTLASNELTVTVKKATPKISAPTASGVYVGQHLSDSVLTGGSATNEHSSAAIAGTFSWTDGATEVLATGKYSVTFSPDDTANYNTAIFEVDLTATQLTVDFVETFNGNSTTTKVNVKYGATLKVADFPQITGHIGYTGKYSTNVDITNVTDFVTVNITYTANSDTAYEIWHIKQNSDGSYPDTATEVEEMTGTTGAQVTANAKSYEGYEFDRNAVGSALTGEIAPDGSLVLKLFYARKSYTLFMNLNGGSGMNSTTALYDCGVVRPADPTRNGYKFAGWYKENDFINLWRFDGDSNADKLTANTTIFAKWEAEEYTIAYTLNRIVDGKHEVDVSYFTITPADNKVSYTINSTSFTLKDPVAEGYTFLGWYIEGTNTKISQIVTGSYGDLALEARWTPATFVVRFDAQGGKADASSMIVTNLGNYGALPAATKSGATFLGWFIGENGTGVQLNQGDPVKLKGDLTVYAYWKEVDYHISFDDSTGAKLTVTKNGEIFDWEIMPVRTGDVLKLAVEPAPGYSIVRLLVNGRSTSNGGNFLVKSGYADNKISVSSSTRLTTYTITYYLNGGVQGKPVSGSWATSYNVETPDIELPPYAEFDNVGNLIPNPACPTKIGYYFNGWFLDSELSESAGDVIAKGTTGNISLYADWGALEQTITFKGNYGGANDDDIQLGYTDEEITLKPCSFEGRAERVDFKFLGWSTTPNGAVEYENGATYIVKPSNNVLYAVWHVANMQFVEITVKNDQMVYGSNNEGIILTPRPGYEYVSADVKLTYQWYRLDANGVYIKYGEPITMLASETNNSPDGTNKASITVHTVAECGTFKCTLIAEGNTELDATDSSGKPITMVTTAKGEGTRAVTMEKAEYGGISFGSKTFVYDGKKHSIIIGNEENLPEGITVSYTGNGVTKVGSFDVVAVFTVSDTGNYKPIDSIKATLTITPKKITSITFVGADPNEPGVFNYVYNGNPFTVTAQFSDILNGDDVRAAMSDNSYSAAGTYTAVVTGIEGADSENYELDASLTSVYRNFTINKASYDVSGIRFNGKSVTYNGTKQSIYVTGGLPAGVSVTYSVAYTPFSSLSGSNGAGNGGENAGTYVVTATFNGDADNYYAIPPRQATLVINKANFPLDYGDFRNTSVSYSVGELHNPSIDLAGQGLEGRLDVSYNYYKSNNGNFESIEIGPGLSAAGVYRIAAQLRFLDNKDINNYNNIPEKIILFNITDLEVVKLEVESYSSRRYVVGDSFDPNEIIVTVWYKDGSYEVLDSSRYNIDPVVFKQAGVCEVTVTYMNTTGKFSVTVGKGDHDLSGITVDNITHASYDKTAKLPEIFGELPQGVTAVYSYSTDGKTYVDLPEGGLVDAGTYYIEISFTHDDTANYNDIARTLKCNLVIERAELGIVFGDAEFVFDGNEHVLTATATGMFADDTVELTLSGNRATNAGSYTATVSLDEIYANYKLPSIGTSKVWTVTAQEVTVELRDPDEPYVYNGKEHTVSVTVRDANNNIIDVKAVVSFGKDVTFRNAGNYTATVIGLVNADGTACTNYELGGAVETLSKDYTVLPKSVTAVWEVAVETAEGTVWQIYDPAAGQLKYTGGVQTSKLRAGFYDGVDSKGDRIYHELTLNFGSESFINAGAYAVSATGSDANYAVTDGAMTIVIAPAAAEVFFEIDVSGNGDWQPLSDANLVYNGKVYAVRAYYTNNAGARVELEITVMFDGIGATLLNAGTYALAADFVFADENYVLTGKESEVVIGQKEITIIWTDPDDLVYDGADKTVTAELSDVVSGDDLTLTLANNVKVRAGDYTATAVLGGTAVGNYKLAAGAATHDYTVAKRAITVTIDDVKVKYNGKEPTAEELAAIGYNITSGSLIDGDSLDLTFNKETGVNVKPGGYAVTGSSSNGDYDVTFVGNYAADTTKGLYMIEKADPTVTPTYKGTLYENKNLNASALKLSAGDTDGTIAFDDISESNGKKPGVHAFAWSFTPADSLNYNTAKGTIEIEVIAVTLAKIEITTTPKKVSYMEDEIFDPTGIVITATFNNGSTEQVQDDVTYSIGGHDALGYKLTLSDDKITITYVRDGVEKSCELSISVTDKVVDKIEIERAPDKLDYVEGQQFDVTGLVLKVTYQGGMTESISGNWAVDLDGVALKTTHTKVVVTYGGVSIDIGINVVKRAVEKIEITKDPDKVKYIEGTDFVPTGMEVKATFNDGTSETVAVGDLNFDKTKLELGDGSVRVSYEFGGKTAYADLNVTVAAKQIVSIEITTAPDKTVYDAFTRFDAKGMVVTATYDNNTKAVITDYTVENTEALTVDVTEVVISANGKKSGVAITVNPIDHDMSGVTFESKTFAYDGKAHGIAISGTLPEGVTVSYSVNGETVDGVALTDIDIYEITAEFTVTDPNYNPIQSMTATLTISELEVFDTDGLGIDIDANVVYNGLSRTPQLVGDIRDANGEIVDLVNAGIGYEIRITRNGDTVEGIFRSGSYIVTVIFNHNVAGYAQIENLNFNVTVGKADLTLTVTDKEIFYGQDAPEFGYTLDGFLGNDTIDNVAITGEIDYVTDYTNGSTADRYAVTANGNLETEDYTINYVAGTLTVKEVFVERIEIVTGPDKTEYLIGEKFDATGMEVRAYYNDGSDKLVTDFTCGDEPLALGTTEVTITYGGKNASVTVSVKLPVMDEQIKFGDLSVVYDGAAHGIEATDLPDGVTVTYLIDGAADKTAVGAGTYTVTARFTVTDGSAYIEDKTAKLTIAKKTIEAELGREEIVADGSEKKLEVRLLGLIDGDDAGLTITYNKTPIAAGSYIAWLAISNPNYELANTEIEFDIRNGEIIGAIDGSDKPGVVVSGENGFKHDTQVNVSKITDEDALNEASANLDGKLGNLYEINLTSGGETIQPDGTVTVRLLITELSLLSKDLKVVRYESDGSVTDMMAVRDGEYMVFETEHFSRYAIVIVGESSAINPVLLGFIIGGAVLLAAAATVIIVFQVRKKNGRGKAKKDSGDKKSA